jgi:hypothetical protein
MKEFEAKVRLNEEDGGKTGELDIMLKPPFDNGYFKGVTYGITFKEPVFEAGKSEWIPCSERLPEKDGEYLVTTHYAIPPYHMFHPENDIYVDDISIQRFDGKFIDSVIAWMPLPTPYKEGDPK